MMRTSPFAFVALVIVSSVAGAQTRDAIGEKLFIDAQEALKAGRVSEACTKFAQSNRADPQLGTLLNLAACHEKDHKPTSAWSEYTQLVDLATKAGDAGRADYARKRAAALLPVLPQMTLHPPKTATVTDVAIDDQSIGTAALTTPVPVDPGAHVLALHAGDRTWTQRVTVAETGTTAIDVSEPPPGPTSTSPPVTHDIVTQPIIEPAPRSSPLRPVGIVVAGVGLAGVVVGSIFGAFALGEQSTISLGCDAGTFVCHTDASYDAARRAQWEATVSTVGFIAGGVLVAVGVTLFFLGAPTKAKAMAAHVTPNGIGVMW